MKGWWVVCLLALAWTVAPADYFSDYPLRPVTPPPSNSWSLLYQGAYFSHGYDHGAALEYNYRLERHYALSGTITTLLGDPSVSASFGFKWFPRGLLRKDGFENYAECSLGLMARKAPWDPADSTSQWTSGPHLNLLYGRDILPWNDASVGLRVSLFGSWTYGHVLARRTTGIFGSEETRLGNITVGFRVGGFWI